MRKNKITGVFLIIVISFSYLLNGCSNNKYLLPTYGVYYYIDDEIISNIEITENTIKIENADFENCRIIHAINIIESYKKEMENEGIIPTQEEIEAIAIVAMEEVDFSKYDNVELSYIIEELPGGDFNILLCDENGDPISGLVVTYYVRERICGFGNWSYELR
jgi:hypothetical protein